MKYDNFTQVPFTADNLDRYFIRLSIMNAIKEEIPQFNGHLLDIGCGKMPYKDYILEKSTVTKYTGLDIETALEYEAGVKPDFTWDGINMPFDMEIFQTAFATEVLEHCPRPEIILQEVFRVLKPGGVFFFTVPFLWPLHEVPHDEYRYTPFSMERILQEAGFTNIRINAFGGWHASLAQMLGLWVRRAPLSKRKRNVLSSLLKPVIGLLIKKDKKIGVAFTEGQMITGISGIAYKP